jgi:hypothetical protein
MLIWIHVVLTFLTVVYFIFLLFFGNEVHNSQPARYFDYNSFNEYRLHMRFISYSLTFLFFGQMTFVINVVAGIFKRFTRALS